MPEPPDATYPFVLLTGRGTAAQWHTQTRTAKSAVLRKLYPPQLYVEINPADARALGIEPQRVGDRRVAARQHARARLRRRTSCSRARSSSRCTTTDTNR